MYHVHSAWVPQEAGEEHWISQGRGAVEGEGELKTKRLGKEDDPERAKGTMGISELKGVREASGREAPELEEEPGCQNSLKCASGTCGAEEPGGQHVL